MAARNTMNVLVVALLSVLVLVLIFLLVIQNQALERRTEDLENAKTKFGNHTRLLVQRDQDVGELRKKITGSADAIQLVDIDEYLAQAVGYLDQGRAQAPQPGDRKNWENFRDLLSKYQNALTRLQGSTTRAEDAARTANERTRQRENVHRTEIQGLRDQTTELTRQVGSLRNEVEDLESRMADSDSRHTQEITEKEDEITELTYRYESDKNLWTQQIAQLNDTVRRLQIERLPPKDLATAEEDGRILNVANRHTAYIDLGRRDFVRPGLVMEVYEKRGAKRFRKGMIEISRVDDTWSQVTISQEFSEMDPIVAGDLLWSPFYKKDHAPRVVFAGEKLATPLLSVDLLKRKLSESGVHVAKDVGIDTDYLIAIEGYTEDPLYEKARVHGVMILRESDILGYVIQ